MSSNRRFTEIDPAPPRAKRKRRTDRPEAPEETSESIWIGSVGVWVPQGWCTSAPLIGQLAGEDFAWRVAMADWNARKPSPLQLGSRSAWRREGQSLREKRQRLARLAAEIGIRSADSPSRSRTAGASDPGGERRR